MNKLYIGIAIILAVFLLYIFAVPPVEAGEHYKPDHHEETINPNDLPPKPVPPRPPTKPTPIKPDWNTIISNSGSESVVKICQWRRCLYDKPSHTIFWVPCGSDAVSKELRAKQRALSKRLCLEHLGWGVE